jgi:hypothetical protein
MVAAGDHSVERLVFRSTEFNSELVQNYPRTPELVNE